MGGRKHLTKAEISGIVIDLRAGKPTYEIMGSWDVSAATVEKVGLAKRLAEERASADRIASYAVTHSISEKMIEWIAEEIDRLKAEELRTPLTEPEIVELENNALQESARANPDEIIYSLTRIEDLLGKLLECWVVGTSGGKV